MHFQIAKSSTVSKGEGVSGDILTTIRPSTHMENHRLVLPEHLNHYGFLFGGYLLMWVDEVAWMAASLDFKGCQFVTVGMRAVAFHESVKQGAILRFETKLLKTGTTSVTYSVSVNHDKTEIFSNSVTMVRIDEEGKKQSLPKL